MEETNWEQRLHALTHLLTNPTIKPSLHSQLFISNQMQTAFHLYISDGVSLSSKRVLRLGPPLTSWRSQCPYQQPPPLILAKGLEYFKKEVKRKRFSGWTINPLIPVLVPNLMLLSILFLKPFSDDDP
ncbi:hypothetical protein MKW92_042350 [Papaver armeniacum]|nr:hypothetical protein MKW92_042350 [Papaver armeniacum]